MNVIKNKKGNTGWIVGYWNFSPTELTCPKDGQLTVYVRPVTVESCGQKQMTLRFAKNGSMAKEFFDPQTPVYKTYADAVNAADDILEEFYRTAPQRIRATLERWKDEGVTR